MNTIAVPVNTYEALAGWMRAHEMSLPPLLLSSRTVANIVGMPPSRVWYRVKKGTFPAPVQIDSRTYRWRTHEVLQYKAAAEQMSPTGTIAVPVCCHTDLAGWMMGHKMSFPPFLLSSRTVANVVGMTPRRMWYRVKKGTFPTPSRLGRRSYRWRTHEVLQYEAAAEQMSPTGTIAAPVNTHQEGVPALLRSREVAELVDLTSQGVWSRVKKGTFPAPVKMDNRTYRWRTHEVLQYKAA